MFIRWLEDMQEQASAQSYKHTPAQFNIFIGLDENNLPLADVIEQEFVPLLNKFSATYYKQSYLSPSRNCYIYNFFANGFNVQIEDETDRIRYLRNVAESTVHRFLHKNAPYSGSAQNLVAVNYIGNDLWVYIAQNQNGIAENAKFTDSLCQSLKQIGQPGQMASVVEKWDSNHSRKMAWGV